MQLNLPDPNEQQAEIPLPAAIVTLPAAINAIEDRLTLQFTPDPLPLAVETALRSGTATRLGSEWQWDMPQMTEDYLVFKKVMLALHGRWTGKTHLFPVDPVPLFEQILEAGKLPQLNPFDLFETPPSTVLEMSAHACLPCDSEYDAAPEERYPYKILEPSAGLGRIALVLRKRLCAAQIDCVEIDPFNREALRSHGLNVVGRDFMELPVAPLYDYVVANPPFMKDAYIDHITKMMGHLRPGGRLVAVAPYGMLFGSSKKLKAFREFVAERGYWEDIGSPFERTSTRCVIIQMINYDPEDLARAWQPHNGTASSHHYNAELFLDQYSKQGRFVKTSKQGKPISGGYFDTQHPWDDLLEELRIDPHDAERRLASEADDIMDCLLKGGCSLLWNDRVRQQVVNAALEGLQNC